MGRIHQLPVHSPPNGPVMPKVFPCDNVNMSLITINLSIAGELSSQEFGKAVKAFYQLLLKNPDILFTLSVCMY